MLEIMHNLEDGQPPWYSRVSELIEAGKLVAPSVHTEPQPGIRQPTVAITGGLLSLQNVMDELQMKRTAVTGLIRSGCLTPLPGFGHYRFSRDHVESIKRYGLPRQQAEHFERHKTKVRRLKQDPPIWERLRAKSRG